MKTKNIANREGTNIRLLDYKTGAPSMFIDYGNVSVVDLASGNRAYASGGRKGGRRVAFDDQRAGTFRLSTQMIPLEVLSLAADGNVTTGAELIVRELLTVDTEIITLTNTPVAGTIYIYPKGAEENSAEAATATGKSITIEDAVDGDEYYAIYVYESETAKKVTFSNKAFPKAYIIWADTCYKDSDDDIIDETIHAYKAVPQAAISLTYQGTGDPMSLDITFDLMEDVDGNVIDFSREA